MMNTYKTGDSKKELKIIITGFHRFTHGGEIAVAICLITQLSKTFPKAQFYLSSIDGNTDEYYLKKIFPDIKQNIHLIGKRLSTKLPWLIRRLMLYMLYIFLYPKGHIVIHLGCDGYSDIVLPSKFLSYLSSISHSYQIILGILYRKPVFLCAMTIGPFTSIITLHLAKFALNRVKLITARENITQNYLKLLNIKSRVELTTDLAFLLEAAGKKTYR